MSVQTANSDYGFRLPKLSYIDIRREEPNVAAPASRTAVKRATGLADWLAAGITAVRLWMQESRDAADLSTMSDRELMDIGINRGDLSRVFNPMSNEDLRRRGTAAR